MPRVFEVSGNGELGESRFYRSKRAAMLRVKELKKLHTYGVLIIDVTAMDIKTGMDNLLRILNGEGGFATRIEEIYTLKIEASEEK